MEPEELIFWFAAIVVFAVTVRVLTWLIMHILAGAVALFGYASGQGFVGLVAYSAAWVFLFPVMLVASFAVGLAIRLTCDQETAEDLSL